MEKKKLLLVSVSVGIFLVVVIGAAVLVFSPRTYPDNINIEEVGIAPGRTSVAVQQITPVQPSVPEPVVPAQTIAVTADSTRPAESTHTLENRIYIYGEDTEKPIRVEHLNDGNTSTYIKFPSTRSADEGVKSTDSAIAAAPVEKQKPAAEPVAAPVQKAKPAVSAPASAPVKQKPAPTPAVKQPAPQAAYWVQTGSFSKKAFADNAKQFLATKQITSVIMDGNVKGKTYYRVRVGPYTTKNEADYWLAVIKSIDGMEGSQVWVSNNNS